MLEASFNILLHFLLKFSGHFLIDSLCHVEFFQVVLRKEAIGEVSNIVEHHACDEAGDFVAVDSVSIKEPKYFNVAVLQDEEVVLVECTHAALLAHELDVLVHQCFLMIEREVVIHVLP